MCKNVVFSLGITNKISVSHLVTHTHTHMRAHTLTHTHTHTCIHIKVQMPVGIHTLFTSWCTNLWDVHQVFGLLLISCIVIIKNVTVYVCVFIFALGYSYRLFILKALATLQFHLKCSILYSSLLSYNTHLEFSLNSFTKCHFHMQCV